MSLIAGVATTCITPPVGFPMGGYGARDHGCEGVHDDLFGKALYLSDGHVDVAIVTADVLGLRAPQVTRVRQRVTELIGLPGDRVFVSCSHTHGGPLMYSDFAAISARHQAYLDTLCLHLAGAVAEARAAAEPARLGQARTDVRLGANRRQRMPDGTTAIGVDLDAPVAPWVDVVFLERQSDESPLALLFQHAVHGTCLGGDNYQVTADTPGVAQALVERALPGVTALFMNGCAGNINPYPRGTFGLCQRHGARLGAAAVKAAMEVDEPTADVCVKCGQLSVDLPLAEALPADECERAYAEIAPAYEALQGETHRNWALSRRHADVLAQVEAARAGHVDTALPVQVQVIALNQLALVGLPGEIFVEIGQRIAAASPYATTLPVGYANGSIGYVPTLEEVPHGGYEVLQGRARHQGRFIRDDADRILVAGATEALLQTAASTNA